MFLPKSGDYCAWITLKDPDILFSIDDKKKKKKKKKRRKKVLAGRLRDALFSRIRSTTSLKMLPAPAALI